jgi:Ca2+-binding RTX toxin-like protein
MKRGALFLAGAIAALALWASPAGAVPAVGTVEVRHFLDYELHLTFPTYTGMVGAEQLSVYSSYAQRTTSFSTPNGVILTQDSSCKGRLVPRLVTCAMPGTVVMVVTAKGGPGNDRISAAGDVNTDLSGDEGNDVLISNARAANLSGGVGLDVLRGGPGSETLAGGDGRDQMYGGAGDDSLSARDGRADEVVDCGPGNDRASVDVGEPTIDCEDVFAF